MPITLTRSILVVLIPGLVALAPWALWMATQLGNIDALYESYTTLINASLVGAAVIIGSLIQGLVSHLEVKWDKEREEQYQVRENWFAYLAQQCSSEPVGFRYISRMFTTMYFELSMMVAAPLSLVGIAFLIYEHVSSCKTLGAGSFLVLAIVVVWYLYRAAYSTHRVLCEARKELNARLSKDT